MRVRNIKLLSSTFITTLYVAVKSYSTGPIADFVTRRKVVYSYSSLVNFGAGITCLWSISRWSITDWNNGIKFKIDIKKKVSKFWKIILHFNISKIHSPVDKILQRHIEGLGALQFNRPHNWHTWPSFTVTLSFDLTMTVHFLFSASCQTMDFSLS